jgi:hypothetical protein
MADGTVSISSVRAQHISPSTARSLSELSSPHRTTSRSLVRPPLNERTGVESILNKRHLAYFSDTAVSKALRNKGPSPHPLLEWPYESSIQTKPVLASTSAVAVHIA